MELETSFGLLLGDDDGDFEGSKVDGPVGVDVVEFDEI